MKFQVLENNPLTVWDDVEKKTIHLGSRVEAVEFADLLNSLERTIDAQKDMIKKLSLANLQLAADRDKCLACLGKLPTPEEDHY